MARLADAVDMPDGPACMPGQQCGGRQAIAACAGRRGGMSRITGILICHSVMEGYKERDDGEDDYQIIDEINVWLEEKG